MTKKARQEAGRKGGKRGGKSRSPAKVAAGRANGRKGGRKKGDLSELFKDIGPAPIGEGHTPLEINEWTQKINARAMELVIAGRASREFVAQVSALTRGIVGTIPAERIHQAGKRIKQAQSPAKPVARKGPPMVPVNDAGPPGTGGGTSIRL